jgi:hypothetical protein
VHRGDREKAAVARLTECLPGVPGQQERACQQHGEQAVPALLGELLDRRDVLEARVRDDRVESTELLERGADGCRVPFARRQIGFEGLARAVGIGTPVHCEDFVPVAFEPPRDRAPDPTGSTCDQHSASHAQTLTREALLRASGQEPAAGGVRMRIGLPSPAALNSKA